MSRTPTFDALLQRLREQFSLLSERDRRALQYGGTLIALIALAGGLWTLNENALSAHARVEQKATLLAELPARLSRASRESKLATVAEAPLASRIERIAGSLGVEPQIVTAENGSTRIILAGVTFDNALEFIADLDAARAPPYSLRITAAGSGRVDVRMEVGARQP